MGKGKKINWTKFLRGQTPIQFLKSSFGFTLKHRAEEYCMRMENRFHWCTKHGFNSVEEATHRLEEYLKKKLPPESIYGLIILPQFIFMTDFIS